MNKDINNQKAESGSTDCSVSLPIPSIPSNAIEFAKRVGDLADEYGIEKATIEIPFRRDGDSGNLRFGISKKDGRGRPRTQIGVTGEITVHEWVVREPDSTN